ncbi:hypothetical protein DFX32_RS17685 [Vibrio parahaemolyticus]|uniref:hypothetical protein n=1 Tax=Vibrio harveyi group TaxID=717610 RepID=UPI001AA18890|nr:MULTISPECIES: hypothetical protein [Vibrio harveyi group]EGQ8329957.1 hypothetical protein [Vibrio parahaemolyticus]EGQ8789152.1 hypothetical protein [Vibrio parahaemolyticus]EGQ8818459.1 hypothetical protein [Vibrio parahaemolyticus]EGQ8848042.1 hypothetical protein [Vibrio parahaemolyticus]EJG0296500.1 hypothetical protein [Vibrio parahaemolyticus]
MGEITINVSCERADSIKSVENATDVSKSFGTSRKRCLLLVDESVGEAKFLYCDNLENLIFEWHDSSKEFLPWVESVLQKYVPHFQKLDSVNLLNARNEQIGYRIWFSVLQC